MSLFKGLVICPRICFIHIRDQLYEGITFTANFLIR